MNTILLFGWCSGLEAEDSKRIIFYPRGTDLKAKIHGPSISTNKLHVTTDDNFLSKFLALFQSDSNQNINPITKENSSNKTPEPVKQNFIIKTEDFNPMKHIFSERERQSNYIEGGNYYSYKTLEHPYIDPFMEDVAIVKDDDFDVFSQIENYDVGEMGIWEGVFHFWLIF